MGGARVARHERVGGRLASVAALLVLSGGAVAVVACGASGPSGAGATGASSAPARTTPTWATDVATILHGSCVTCHRPGGSAPFSLLTYADAARRADKIADATTRRVMPPWLPDPGVGEFSGDRRLPEGRIETLRRWAAAGAPEGDPAGGPAPPVFASEWSLGEPDLVVELPEDTVPARGRDLYQNLIGRVPIQEGRWVRALELRPGNNRVVHHARLMVDTTASSRELAARDAARTLEVMHVSTRAYDPDGFFLGWTPGKVPDAGRPDLAWRIEPGADLVLQVHLRPSGTVEVIRPRVGFYFAVAPPTKTATLILMRSLAIDIAPGDTAFVAQESYRVPVTVDVLSIYPHAHYVGKRLEAWAVQPDGRRRDLIRISDWNFNWQDAYRYARPVRLPAGSILTMHYTYDNSSSNPRNPFDPPRRIVYGLSSTDEMAELILQVLPADPDDLAVLENDLERFYYQAGLREEAAGLLARARTLGDEGRLAEALDLYRRSLLARNDARVMAEMAAVVLRQGDASSAVVVARRAVELSAGGDPRILGTLARSLAAAGQADEARRVLRQAVDLARRRGLGALADSLSTLARSWGGPGGR